MVRVASSCTAAALLFAASAAGYEGTAPLIVRSSRPHDKRALPSLSGRASAHGVYDSLAELGCAWDALLVLDVQDLHYSSLASHPVHTQTDAYSTLVSVPYLPGASAARLERGIEAWHAACGGGKEVSIQRIGAGESASPAIAATADKHANHLILITGSPALNKRQMLAPDEEMLEEGAAELLWDEEYAEEMSEDVDALLDEMLGDEADEGATYDYDFDDASGAGDWDEAEDPAVWDNADGYYDLSASKKNGSHAGDGTRGPLLEHAQIFTTPIITALLVTFGIFIPVLGLGVSALAGIQVPPQMMNIAKTSAVSQGRKDQ